MEIITKALVLALFASINVNADSPEIMNPPQGALPRRQMAADANRVGVAADRGHNVNPQPQQGGSDKLRYQNEAKREPQGGAGLERQRGGQRQKAPPPLPKGLATSSECGEDVQRICGSRNLQSNLEILACLTNSRPSDEDLSLECHQHLWNFKNNITKDPKFDNVARDICKVSISKFPDCQNFDEKSGKLIPCLLSHKDEIKVRPCYHFLVKMGTIIYSDYRLICDFVENCGKDVNALHCGRVNSGTVTDNDTGDLHSQGSVIACLEEKIVQGHQVEESCAKQIVRLTELSADDFHLDRNLYFKCKDDRERMCEETVAGEGRVYKCLFRHKFDHEMSSECRGALTVRQQLVAQDYKASYELNAMCTKDIEKYKCVGNQKYHKSGTNDHNDFIGLSGILLCLEDARLDGGLINDQCNAQLDDYRRMLSEDYELSPEIVTGCAREISDSCNEGVKKHGETIHCLMALDRKPGLSSSCEEAIMHLLKEDHAVSDYRMDFALAEACNPVVITACGTYSEGDPMILSCLMEHLYADVMKPKCRKRLLEMQYFIGRDFFLDPVFFKKCRNDAKRLCEIDNLQQESNDISMPYSLVVSCLYRHIRSHDDKPSAKSKQTTSGCAQEVFRVMKHRALDVNLNPDLESACRLALGEFCSEEMAEKGTELICLQDHFGNITDEDCLAKLEEVTEIEEAEAGKLENVLMEACRPDVESYCKDELENDDDEGAVMRCLIENKEELDDDCQVGVTHFELIDLKIVKFSYAFMKACKDDIDDRCEDLIQTKHTKNDIINCLSRVNVEAQLQDKRPLSRDCLDQLTVKNLQKHEDLRLDPELQRACQADYSKFCSKVKKGKAKGIECLRSHRNNLSKSCKIKIFGFEQEEVADRRLDFSLMRSCKASVKKWCQPHISSGDPQLILDCLIHHKDYLDQGCRDIVLEREREEFSDINLHPLLKKACLTDIVDKCKNELLSQETDEENGADLMGRVIGCLKDKHTSPNTADALTEECSRHINFVLQEEQNDYRLDPMLTLHCIKAIDNVCSPKRGNVVECLKSNYFKGTLDKYPECMVEIARLLREGRYDIMADPVLHNMCLDDIRVHCSNIAEGRGRIMGCLLGVIDGGRERVTQQCADAMKQRKKMWSFAATHNVASFGEVSNLIWRSPHHSYFLTVITVFLMVILLLGLMCGRLTKRVSRQRKML